MVGPGPCGSHASRLIILTDENLTVGGGQYQSNDTPSRHVEASYGVPRDGKTRQKGLRDLSRSCQTWVRGARFGWTSDLMESEPAVLKLTARFCPWLTTVAIISRAPIRQIWPFQFILRYFWVKIIFIINWESLCYM